MIAYLFRRALAETRHALTTAGYWIRPYDMLADNRRWRWTPPTCCRCGKPAWPWTHRRTR